MGSLSLLFAATAFVSACASNPPPNEQISLAKNAVSRAVSAGATEYAPMQMKSAQDKVFLMERAIGEQNFVQVKTLAEQIEIDAALAERTARTVKSQKELTDAQSGIQVLKREMLQAPGSGLNPASTQTN
ncbi:DUF4398 domain-containing protein [Pseudomonas sp. MDT1-16]|uniref:DUF4398 domain-containing protein n=1 Tax=Pseudomonas sp. AL03 TaxID=3042230 RepID=UPI00249A8317|nr:DUF4398 domain-containing protein [Pseudomonas sp. AL03]MDI3270815.1 DUF4398 domain-containing protein [Pseudomonas sp. AL03]